MTSSPGNARKAMYVDELGPSPAYNPSLILLGTKKTWLNDFFFLTSTMRAWAKRNKKVPLPKEMKKREENLKKGKIKK